MAAGGNDNIPVTQRTLHKRLNERGILVSCDQGRGKLTVRRTLEGKRRNVLHLLSDTLMAEETAQSAQKTQSPSPEIKNSESWADHGAENDTPVEKSAHEKGPRGGDKTLVGSIGPIGPEMETHKRSLSEPPTWDEETKRLAERALGLEVYDFPPAPFEIRPGERIIDTGTYLESLKREIRYGESHPRSVNGALQDDLARLWQLQNKCNRMSLVAPKSVG